MEQCGGTAQDEVTELCENYGGMREEHSSACAKCYDDVYKQKYVVLRMTDYYYYRSSVLHATCASFQPVVTLTTGSVWLTLGVGVCTSMLGTEQVSGGWVPDGSVL